MIGQFLFASCHSIGFRARALMRNTARDTGTDDLLESMTVDVSVYRAGKLLATYPEFGEVRPEGMLEISAETCPELGSDGEHLVLAQCSQKAGREYFPQEHQLIYEVPAHRTATTLLYDQIPVPVLGKTPSPIVLIAPKAWVSSELACWIVFATVASPIEENGGFQSRPLEITVLDHQGTVVASDERVVRDHDVVIFDVREAVAGRPLSAKPVFFDVVARGGAGSFAIFTLLFNETTGACAIEHSLSPHYYASRLERVRDEALLFPGLGDVRSQA